MAELAFDTEDSNPARAIDRLKCLQEPISEAGRGAVVEHFMDDATNYLRRKPLT